MELSELAPGGGWIILALAAVAAIYGRRWWPWGFCAAAGVVFANAVASAAAGALFCSSAGWAFEGFWGTVAAAVGQDFFAAALPGFFVCAACAEFGRRLADSRAEALASEAEPATEEMEAAEFDRACLEKISRWCSWTCGAFGLASAAILLWLHAALSAL